LANIVVFNSFIEEFPWIIIVYTYTVGA